MSKIGKINIMIPVVELDEGWCISTPPGCDRFLFVSISNDCHVINPCRIQYSVYSVYFRP